MAKNGQYNGQLAEALRVLDRADRADRSSVGKALTLVRRSGVLRDEELIDRYKGLDCFAVNTDLGRLVLADNGKSETHSWLQGASSTAKRLLPAMVTYDDRWQEWKLPHTPSRSRQGLGEDLHTKGGVAQKLAVIALQPTIRIARLATSDHASSKQGPRDSLDNVLAALEVKSAQNSLTNRTQEPFREALQPEYDKYLYETYADNDVALVRTRRFLGSYTRPAVVVNRRERAQLRTVQSFNFMQQTTYALTPEWRDLVQKDTAAESFSILDPNAAEDIGAFIAEQEVCTPLVSSLQVQQRYEILQTQPA